LAISSTLQKSAKNTQNNDSVTALIKIIESQNRIGMNWPSQNTNTFIEAGTLFWED
jgi:hypothetical protein